MSQNQKHSKDPESASREETDVPVSGVETGREGDSKYHPGAPRDPTVKRVPEPNRAAGGDTVHTDLDPAHGH